MSPIETGKTSEEIERDVERTRARLSGRLGELRDRMSPQQVVEDLMDYARGGDAMNAIGRTVRDNPMPVLLIGAGLGWLMLSGSGRADNEVRHGVRGQGMHPGGRRFYGEGEHAGPSWTERAGAAASSMGESASSALRGAAQSASDAAGSALRGASHMASDAMSSAGRGASDYGGRGMRAARGAGGGAFDALRDQPLVLAAIGLAMGATLGAALPTTETEDEWFGDTSDAMKREAGDLSREGVDKAKAVAARAYEGGKSEAESQGLTGNGAGDRAAAAAERAKTDVQDQTQKSSAGPNI